MREGGMAHQREKFPARCVLLVDGEGVPVVLEVFGGVDKVGTAPARWHAWSAVLGAISCVS
jgi:hypothetical protein